LLGEVIAKLALSGIYKRSLQSLIRFL
jgi:hypothetical protein